MVSGRHWRQNYHLGEQEAFNTLKTLRRWLIGEGLAKAPSKVNVTNNVGDNAIWGDWCRWTAQTARFESRLTKTLMVTIDDAPVDVYPPGSLKANNRIGKQRLFSSPTLAGAGYRALLIRTGGIKFGG